MKYILIFLLFSQTISTTFSTCSTNDECEQLQYKECKEGKCICEDHYTYDRSEKKCMPMITETDCKDDLDICKNTFGQRTYCTDEDKCDCKQAYSINEDKTSCVTVFSKITCDKTQDCAGPSNNAKNLICDTEAGKCICAENYVINSDDTQCLEILSKVTCSSNNDCTIFDGNSECKTKSKRCGCKSGYKFNSDGSGCEPGSGEEENIEEENEENSKEDTERGSEIESSNSCSFLSISLIFIIVLF